MAAPSIDACLIDDSSRAVLLLQPQGKLRVLVTDVTGEPASGVKVVADRVSSASAAVLTDAAFRAADATAPGTYELDILSSTQSPGPLSYAGPTSFCLFRALLVRDANGEGQVGVKAADVMTVPPPSQRRVTLVPWLPVPHMSGPVMVARGAPGTCLRLCGTLRPLYCQNLSFVLFKIRSKLWKFLRKHGREAARTHACLSPRRSRSPELAAHAWRCHVGGWAVVAQVDGDGAGVGQRSRGRDGGPAGGADRQPGAVAGHPHPEGWGLGNPPRGGEDHLPQVRGRGAVDGPHGHPPGRSVATPPSSPSYLCMRRAIPWWMHRRI